MEYIIISVPDKNDSVSRIVLLGTVYQIRFTYNDTYDYWKFSLYDSQGNPIMVGIKIVPVFPLNIFSSNENMPNGVFGVLTKKSHIGRNDFKEGKASFIFCPAQ